MLEDIWGEFLETQNSVSNITLNRFLSEFDKKMEMSRDQEIDILEKRWFYFEKNPKGDKNEWASETVSRLKKLVKNLAALNRIKNWNEVIKKLYSCDTLRATQEKIGLMMPHVLESESWEVLEKQIDLYEMEKRDTIAKGCLKGKTGKGDKKKVNYTDQSKDWTAENEWTTDGWNTDNDWSGDWGTEQSSDEKCVESADDQWVNKTAQDGKKGKKGKKGRGKGKGKGKSKGKNKPPSGYSCWACGSADHYIGDCHKNPNRWGKNQGNEKSQSSKMSAKITEIVTDETKVPDTPSTKTFKTRVFVNIGQKWSTPENEFGGVLDTGFTGGALCSKRWLKAYEDFMIKTHNSKPFVREPAVIQTFIFGNDQERWSNMEVSLPVWVVNKWKYIRCRVIPGNLELLIGNKVVTELDMAIRMATDTIRLGQGRWT